MSGLPVHECSLRCSRMLTASSPFPLQAQASLEYVLQLEIQEKREALSSLTTQVDGHPRHCKPHNLFLRLPRVRAVTSRHWDAFCPTDGGHFQGAGNCRPGPARAVRRVHGGCQGGSGAHGVVAWSPAGSGLCRCATCHPEAAGTWLEGLKSPTRPALRLLLLSVERATSGLHDIPGLVSNADALSNIPLLERDIQRRVSRQQPIFPLRLRPWRPLQEEVVT